MGALVTISIFALLSTISIPYLRKYQANLKLNGVARNLTSDIRYAQQLTIMEQNVHTVELDPINNRYEIIKTGAATTTIKSVDFPLEIQFNYIDPGLGNQIVFNSFGGVSDSGEIILQNNDSKLAAINIKPSGYIQLSQ